MTLKYLSVLPNIQEKYYVLTSYKTCELVQGPNNVGFERLIADKQICVFKILNIIKVGHPRNFWISAKIRLSTNIN